MANDHSDLRRYCDLTWSQWYDLRDANDGTLQTMNGARRAVMADLIGADLRTTTTGKWLAERAARVEKGTFEARRQAGYDQIIPSQAAARLKRLAEGNELYSEAGYYWLTSANIKLLRAVYREPDEIVGWQRTIFGGETIRNTVLHGWLKGTMQRWSLLELTPGGLRVLEWAQGHQTAAHEILTMLRGE
ncbi:MAG: hypothetical protein ABFE07_18830 [Armatimonadia bacterium]